VPHLICRFEVCKRNMRDRGCREVESDWKQWIDEEYCKKPLGFTDKARLTQIKAFNKNHYGHCTGNQTQLKKMFFIFWWLLV
jgi:hypothetical protein